MNYKGIIFDLDGTLTDTLSMCVQAFRQAIEPLSGRSFSDEEIVATFGPSEEGVIMELVPHEYEKGLAGYLTAYESLLPSSKGLFPGSTELLSELTAAGIKLGIVTGKGAGSATITLDRYGLSQFFSDIATGSPKGSIKAACIREIVGRWGFKPDEVLYVGDAPSDITAAREAGIGIVSVTWSPEADEAALKALQPDAIAGRIDELKTWIFKQ